MKAMQVTQYNTPLVLQKLDMPQAARGEVVVQVATCGLNFGDTLLVKGSYQEKPQLPFTPGMELAGTITAVGDGVTGIEVGQRVAAYSGVGGLAEFAALRADICVSLPDDMSFEDAAAF